MGTYILIPEKGNITINDSAKEDFKKMMGWSEEEFNKRTMRLS